MADTTLDRLHTWDSSYGSAQAAAGTASGSTKRIQDLLDANPYRNVTYNVSPWQKFLSALGFRTQADAWKENMTIQANEYDAGILAKQADEQYNSPTAQAQRMQAAGMNPNLNGGQSIDSGSAAPMGEDPSTPMQSTGEEGVLTEFANGVMSIFSSSLGILETFQGINRNHLQNTLLAIQGESDFAAWANGLATRFLPSTPDPVIDEETGAATTWQHHALQSANMFAKRTMSRKLRSKFISHVQSFWNSAPGDAEAFKAWKSVQDEGLGYAVSRGKYGDLTNQDVLFGIAERLGPLVRESLESGLNKEVAENNASIEKAGYEGSYYQHLSAEDAASAANSTNKAAKEMNDVNSKLRHCMNDILDFLKDASSGKGVGAGLAKIAYALFSMQSLGMLPNIKIPGL